MAGYSRRYNEEKSTLGDLNLRSLLMIHVLQHQLLLFFRELANYPSFWRLVSIYYFYTGNRLKMRKRWRR